MEVEAIMLIEFRVTNFRSFKETVEFSMETGKYLKAYKDSHTFTQNKKSLLKTALLFGGNANGKTNLLEALQALKWLLINPTQTENYLLRTDTFSYNGDNTKFFVQFIKNEKEFQYEFEYNKDEIVKEILKVNNDIFFERSYQNFNILPDGLISMSQNIRKNTFLLFFAQSNNIPDAMTAYSWIYNDLISVNTDEIDNGVFQELKNKEFKEKFLCFLKAADFNVIDVEVKEQLNPMPAPLALELKNVIKDFDESMFKNNVSYEIYSKHKSKDGEFEVHFNNESRGTKIFMFLAIYILKNKQNGKILLIDEFDQSFHQELAEALLDLFNNEKQKNQFILTTHELELMNYNLRPDQIWFAEKSMDGETELFSVYDFEDKSLTRMDYGYKKRYLQGRYGGKQIIHINQLTDILGD